MRHILVPVVLTAYLLPGCELGSEPDAGLEVPDTYAFESRFSEGESVSYSGQTFRHALIVAQKQHLAGLTARIDNGELMPAPGDLVAELNFFHRFDSASAGSLPIGIVTDPPTVQTTWDDLSTDKDLQGKIAGADPEGQHRDWLAGIDGVAGSPSPEALVQSWFEAIEVLAIDRANGTVAMAPDGSAISSAFVSPEGLDYQQLLQKFLTGAVAYSQATDDYLDDDLPGKGLLADNTKPVDGKPYTALEHAWDEGFGYYGATRDALMHSDDEVADVGAFDADGDGAIDLRSEYTFGHAQNAAKRDRGSSASAPTDFSEQAMQAFLTGRTIIASADGALSDRQLEDLRAQRDAAVEAWEMAIVATVVHYINDVLADMASFDTENYDFEAHAKHWSELEGFALSLQFNPHRQISDADLRLVYDLIGDAPALPGDAGASTYADDLRTARQVLGEAYAIDAANLGNDEGGDGW